MIKLPHGEKIRFVKDIVERDENKILLNCVFPYEPTLSMVCEASAQGCAAFSTEEIKPKIGFLVSMKNVKKLNTFSKKEYLIEIEKNFTFNNMSEYQFTLKDSNIIYSKGTLTIAIQE